MSTNFQRWKATECIGMYIFYIDGVCYMSKEEPEGEGIYWIMSPYEARMSGAYAIDPEARERAIERERILAEEREKQRAYEATICRQSSSVSVNCSLNGGLQVHLGHDHALDQSELARRGVFFNTTCSSCIHNFLQWVNSSRAVNPEFLQRLCTTMTTEPEEMAKLLSERGTRETVITGQSMHYGHIGSSDNDSSQSCSLLTEIKMMLLGGDRVTVRTLSELHEKCVSSMQHIDAIQEAFDTLRERSGLDSGASGENALTGARNLQGLLNVLHAMEGCKTFDGSEESIIAFLNVLSDGNGSLNKLFISLKKNFFGEEQITSGLLVERFGDNYGVSNVQASLRNCSSGLSFVTKWNGGGVHTDIYTTVEFFDSKGRLVAMIRWNNRNCLFATFTADDVCSHGGNAEDTIVTIPPRELYAKGIVSVVVTIRMYNSRLLPDCDAKFSVSLASKTLNTQTIHWNKSQHGTTKPFHTEVINVREIVEKLQEDEKKRGSSTAVNFLCRNTGLQVATKDMVLQVSDSTTTFNRNDLNTKTAYIALGAVPGSKLEGKITHGFIPVPLGNNDVSLDWKISEIVCETDNLVFFNGIPPTHVQSSITKDPIFVPNCRFFELGANWSKLGKAPRRVCLQPELFELLELICSSLGQGVVVNILEFLRSVDDMPLFCVKK